MEPEPKATGADRDRSHEANSGQEEDQEAASVTVTGQFKSGRWVPRSCHACNSKKIKCDKKDPCSACTRAGRPCAFPSPGPRKRRTRKAIMADMASRISRLEESLTRAGDGAISESPLRDTDKETPFSQPRTASLDSTASGLTGADILVHNASGSQYFNEVIFSKFIEGERNFETATTPAPTTAAAYSPFNAMGILSSPSLVIVPSSLHPAQAVAVKLWNIYVDGVETCAGLKLLHIPTDQVKVYSLIDNPGAAPFDNLALGFAIYYAATLSLDDSQAQMTLGEDKMNSLLRFKTGLEQALAYRDFLDCPTLTGLRALAIYLSALRACNRGKGVWILNGLAVRIAQALGLHRDGERLGLSTFQSEMRRRLWWHLLTRKRRGGEDYGLDSMDRMLLNSEVRLPVNVEDADLYLDMDRLPEPRKCWTPMTFSLITIELSKAMQQLDDMIATSSASSKAPSEGARLRVMEETRSRIEEWLAYCNPVIPQHRITIACSRFLLQKLDFLTRLRFSLLQRPFDPRDIFTEENLNEALQILNLKLHSEDGLLTQFAWVRKAYPQFHVAMYVLWHLCIQPEGIQANSAWKAIEELFTQELGDDSLSTMDHGSKWAVLSALKSKAFSAREKKQRNHHAGSGPAPAPTVDRDDDSLPVSGLSLSDGDNASVPRVTSLLEDMPGNQFDLDWGGDWDVFTQGLQIDGASEFWQ